MLFRMIRSQKVITDADLAKELGTTTKNFSSFLRRGKDLLPQNGFFMLNKSETEDLTQNYCFTRAERLRYAKRLPYVFNAAGALAVFCMWKKSPRAKKLRDKFFTLPQISQIDIEEFCK